MLFLPVFVYTEPRSAKLQPDQFPLPAVATSRRGVGVPIPIGAGKSHSLVSPSRPFPSFNPFAFKRLRTLLRNGRSQLLSFQALPDSFYCNGGVPPSQAECPPTRSLSESGGWTHSIARVFIFHLSQVTDYGARLSSHCALRERKKNSPPAAGAFSCPEWKGGVLATPLPRENSRGRIPWRGGGMTCTNHKPRPAMIKKEGRCVALHTEPQQCGKLLTRSGKEVPISLSADGVGAAGAPRGGAGACGSAV
jgi:hypothetical protein